MKKYILFISIFILGGITAFAQSYVNFHTKPPMVLNKQTQYQGYKVKYNSTGKSTIYLELKDEKQIIASGALEVNKGNNKIGVINLKSTPTNQSLRQNATYTYNLYMYKGGRNDYSRKSCKSVTINGVRINDNSKRKKPSNILSLRNFFN